MAQMTKIPLLGQFFQTRNKAVHPNTCLNYYPELITKSDDAIAPQQQPAAVMYPTHGTVLAGTCTSGSVVQGLFSFGTTLVAICNGIAWEFAQNLTTGALSIPTNRGVCAPAGVPAAMVSSGSLTKQFFITSGIAGSTIKFYGSFNPAGAIISISAVTDPTNITAPQCDYQDGYVVFPFVGTNKFYITNLADFSTIGALNFASSTTTGSNLVATKFFKQYLILFTTQGAEVWYNAGTTTINGLTTTFPFQRVADVYIDKGTNAPFSIIANDTALFWLSHNEHGQSYFVRAGGKMLLVPEIISTPPISSLLDSIAPLYQAAAADRFADCISYCFYDAGHEFLVWTFPIGNLTLVYDNTTKLWHTWASGAVSNVTGVSTYGRHISNCYAYLNGYHYVGDFSSGNIYTLSTSAYTDNGTTITREVTSSYLNDLNKRMSVNRLEVDITGSAGSITLYTSKDGGNTYVSQGAQTFGTTGSYLTRVFWTLLGMARNWAFKLVTSSAVEHVIVNGIADLEEGDS